MLNFARSNIYLILLVLIICGIYYKLFLFGKVPFPGDLLITSYSPWFDYYKFPTQNPLISDIFSQFFLWKTLSIESLKNLDWPLWNPYSFSGTPLLATYHSGTLYPLNILLLFPKYLGWGLFIFSSSLVASLTMYIFLSTFLKNNISRVIGALIYTFSGLMTTWAEFGTAVHGMAWIPLALFSIQKYNQHRKLWYLTLLILSLILVILAGNAQITTYAFFLTTSFSIVALWTKSFKGFFLKIIPVFISLVIAIGISMPQLLPSYNLLQKSIRSGDTYTQNYNFGLLPPGEIFKFFIADFYGHPGTRNYWGFLNYSETSGFLGTLTLPLLLFSLIYLRKNKFVYFFMATLLLSLFLLFDNKLSSSLYKLEFPLLTSSFASRILFMVSLAASVLSALAANHIITEKMQEMKFLRVSIWSLAAISGIALGTYISNIWVKNLSEFVSPNLIPDYSLHYFKTALRNLILPVLISLSLFIGIFSTRKFPNQLIGLILLSLLLTIDLGRYFLKFNPFVSAEYIFPKTPSIEFLQTRPGVFRIGREHAEVLPPNTWTAYKLQSFEGYDPIYLANYSSFMHFLNNGDISGNADRYAELSGPVKSPFIDAANIKYFIGILRDNNGHVGGELMYFRFNKANYPIVFKNKSSVIVENPNALDRVYFAKTATVASDPEIKNAINTGGLNPKEQALLSKNLNVDSPTGSGEAKILSYEPNSVNIQTKTLNEEILILADQFEEGWHAKIDGVEVPISPANLIFRAVKVPAGNHNIYFYYWPSSFSTGLKIAAASIIFGIFCLFFVRIPRSSAAGRNKKIKLAPKGILRSLLRSSLFLNLLLKLSKKPISH